MRRLNRKAPRIARKAVTAIPMFLLTISASHAALPPYWQGVTEIEAIIRDQQVVNALQGNMIERIETLSPDHIRVTAGRCHADVRLQTRPRTNPGPRLFTVILTDHGCTD